MNIVTCFLLLAIGIGADAKCTTFFEDGFLTCVRQLILDVRKLNPCPSVHSFTKCVSSEITSCDEKTRNAAQLLLNGFASLYNCTARLTNGMSYVDLHAYHKISASSLCHIIPETCAAIYENLKDEVLQVPNSPQQWKTVAERFNERWNLPHCCGALDGKHIEIVKPKHSGSLYFNYKKYFSVVLFALVDADYKFIIAHVGTNGRVNDAGIYETSGLADMLEKNKVNMPASSDVEGFNGKMPYFIVGDDAFPLKSYLMKPYPHKSLTIKKRIFNYRLSRARRISENVFGILANRFRVLHTAIALSPSNIDIVVMATVCLHNHLRMLQDRSYCAAGTFDTETLGNHNVVAGLWRDEDLTSQLTGMQREGGNNSTRSARQIRDSLSEYFSSPHGWLPWQFDKVLAGEQ